MDAFAIVIDKHPISETGFSELVKSSKEVKNPFSITRFDAVVPDQVQQLLKQHHLFWNYPTSGSVIDIAHTGLRKTAYGERNPLRRIACSLSHFLLWKKCVEIKTPILILEHDAAFIEKLNPSDVVVDDFDIVGINDPRQATFSYQRYHDMIQSNSQPIQPVPVLTDKTIPQGLAGNSAYIIKPNAAAHLIDLCGRYGLWPNDAIMCHQLCDKIGVTKTYYTKVQGLRSTTSL